MRTHRYDQIHDLWNPRAIEQLGFGCFAARLITLSKAWPSIPQEEQFLPITSFSQTC